MKQNNKINSFYDSFMIHIIALYQLLGNYGNTSTLIKEINHEMKLIYDAC